MSTKEAQRSWALNLLEQEGVCYPRALDLARFLSPAVFVEPELLRAIRIKVLPALDVGVEADLWFGRLVRSRGVDGIRLHQAVAEELRSQLKEYLKHDSDSMRRHLRDAQQVMERVHRNLSPALALEEKLSWLAIYGDQGAIENELGKVLVAITERDRPGLLRWWTNAQSRLPDAVRASLSGWLLDQRVRPTGGRVRLSVAEAPKDLQEIDLRAFLTGVPDVKMGVRRKNGQLELGEIEGEGAAAIELPDTDPRVVEVSFEEQHNLKRESVSVPLGEAVQLSVGLGAIELRTARGVVYRLPEIEQRGQRATSYKVFVSSTFEDLKEHRAHVIRQLRRAGFFVDPMEDWPAGSDEPKQFSQERLAGCDMCVLLVAFRRGYVPEGETRSITQLEYESAIKQGIDVLIFMLAEDAPWPRKFVELEKDPGIKAWREDLRKRHVVESFSLDPHSIDIIGTLSRWLAKKRPGQSKSEMIERIDWPAGKSPYPGLNWFDQDYAPMFFGRDREVGELVNKLSQPGGRLLIVSGPTGSGKSSLVAAGLWQALVKEGRLPGSHHWRWLRITPGVDSRGPFASLAAGLQHVFPKVLARADDLALTLAGDPAAFAKQIIPQLSQGQELVLFVDQLEELFTQGYPSAEIQSFLVHLVTLSSNLQNRLRVVATIQSEFVGRLAESEGVLEKINNGFHVLMGPISLMALKDMIQKPADATGYTFEPQLVETILDDAGNEPGNLPLVAYALKQLFERRQDRTFTRTAYQTMGGVVGSIGSEADRVMATLGQKAGAAFDRVFAELVYIERDRPPTRKRAGLSRFSNDDEAVKVIQVLAGPECRVLVTAGEGQGATVEVAHEKLFLAWPRLKEWIDESGEALRLIDHATEAAQRWRENGDNPQELWLGTRAKEVQVALQRFGKNPSPVLERFLRPEHLSIEQLNQATIPHELRALIGRILIEFGDPRAGVGLRLDGLPDIVWIEIPGGQVKLENVDHVFEVKPFLIAKYPVTNAQFETFLRAEDGYGNEEWWKDIEQSHEASKPSWQEANSPRETVSWYEAVAFSHWLSAKTGTSIRLPTEWEWQQAAMGGDPQREYPWEGGWDVNRCNSAKSGLNRTTAVGMYPQGATEQGVLDMAGNVWEWCLNTRDELNTTIHTGGERVFRGGAWNCSSETLRVSTRVWEFPALGNYNLGFRLVQDLGP